MVTLVPIGPEFGETDVMLGGNGGGGVVVEVAGATLLTLLHPARPSINIKQIPRARIDPRLTPHLAQTLF